MNLLRLQRMSATNEKRQLGRPYCFRANQASVTVLSMVCR
jgi:hypothetical protein